MTTTQQIETVLRERVQTRSDDKMLILAVWEELGLKLTKEQIEVFYDLPSTETIRRVRQKLQEQGKYLATKEVQQFREVKSQEVQQTVFTASPQGVQNVLEQRTKVDPWSNS